MEIAKPLITNGRAEASIVSGLAAALVANGRFDEAIAMLEPHMSANTGDLDATYALLHALFAGFVRGQGIGSTRDGQSRFRTVATSYIEAKGWHAAVVSEWLGVMGSSQ
jgi:hypothetical protein